ncbi:MAG: biotin/lipoate A/B protein ligase family protein [Candidatus Thermoplasmatota archaeon]|nr:biotin/lipoate A/B protein ligase family protein [Candidatus Thermoplasmatota archaeon]
MAIRVIDTGVADPYYVTALDEAIAIARSEGKSPDTIHFYSREPPGISVGYSKKIAEDVNPDECKKAGVKVVRRTSGGGTIFTDTGCLIYSIARNEPLKVSPEENFKKVCGAIVDTLAQFGIWAERKLPNDVLLDGAKISGSAQIRKGNTTLIHGTFLLDTNVELMRKVLKNVKEVDTIRSKCGFVPDVRELKREFAERLASAFGETVEPGSPTEYELALAKKLIAEKYGNDEWNLMR